MNIPPNHSPPELEQFKTEIEFLLKPRNPRSHSLTYGIRRLLRQFNLQTAHTENEVIHEACLRGIKLTASGEAILCPEAWIRKTALNIVREWSRQARRQTSIADKLKKDKSTNQESLVGVEVIEANFRAVQVALQELSEVDLAILQFSIEGYSWKRIRERLILMGEPEQTEAALRKRKQRILERLRKLYHQQTLPI
ncbi:MAG TPA: hypothetical protein V6D18_02925 [Thermosynechococcaceae cyanobacterium]